MTDEDAFDREMRDADWERVYERQAARGDLTARLCELLGLEAGDSVLELGSGPGYVSAQLADEVAPGTVYALDRSVGALRYLRANTARTARVQALCGDVTALPLRFSAPIPTIATFLFHHVEAVDVAIDAIASVLPRGSPLLVAEYHPEAAGDVGPPPAHRLAPERIRTRLAESGFTLDDTVTLPDEKYVVLAER